MKLNKTNAALFSILSVFALMGPGRVEAVEQIGPGLFFEGHQYILTTPGNWQELEDYAQAEGEGGHLVTIESQAENDWLAETMGALAVAYLQEAGLEPNCVFWLGLYRDDSAPNGWSWSSGYPYDPSSYFTNWNQYGSAHEPNNCDGIEDRATMFGPSESPVLGNWNDINAAGYGCSGYQPYTFGILEYPYDFPIGDVDMSLGAVKALFR